MLHVSLEQRSSDRLWLSAQIEDTGPGISDDDQEKLFEPFSRAKGELNTQEGTGLGLAITRNYARLMGGDVTVTSSLGLGSLFRFEIPVERGDAGVAVKQSAPRRVKGIRAGTPSPRILVADDQFENRDWLMRLLTAVGFSVQGASDGEAAIRGWGEWNPQLILMDVHMPVMDGLEATQRIKSEPRGKETAIVVLTASAMNDDRKTATQSGADPAPRTPPPQPGSSFIPPWGRIQSNASAFILYFTPDSGRQTPDSFPYFSDTDDAPSTWLVPIFGLPR